MIKKLKQSMTLAVASFSLLIAGLLPAVVGGIASADNAIVSGTCSGVDAAAGAGTVACGSAASTGSVTTLASSIVKWFSWLVGIVSVIMIVYAGFRYITSGGDSGKVGSAKNALIYAIIGLVIVGLSQFIVHFAIGVGANQSVSNP